MKPLADMTPKERQEEYNRNARESHERHLREAVKLLRREGYRIVRPRDKVIGWLYRDGGWTGVDFDDLVEEELT